MLLTLAAAAFVMRFVRNVRVNDPELPGELWAILTDGTPWWKA
jgi:hypothetical protein